MNTESPKTPLVLLHGLASGVGLWVLNLDALSEHRPVYALDILGFGRSSRSKFDTDALKAEHQLISSVEEWRREMNINEMILLGHSMGGFLAASYAIHHPDRVKHLILADPWGFPEKPADVAAKYNMPLWVRAIAFAVQPLNPLWAVRAAGPLGQWVVEKTRPDIVRKYASVVEDEDAIPRYIHQCNAQTPTGESAFHSMMSGFGWAKHPMIHRMKEIRDNIPITLLYGSRSWMDNSTGQLIKESGHHNYVNVQIITGAGHHVYADKPEIFNKYVNDACNFTDTNIIAVKTLQNASSNKSENTESDQDDESSVQQKAITEKGEESAKIQS